MLSRALTIGLCRFNCETEMSPMFGLLGCGRGGQIGFTNCGLEEVQVISIKTKRLIALRLITLMPMLGKNIAESNYCFAIAEYLPV